ncbi:hypothetical protein GGTG_02558 [Gaeumannomyces tritici R3-111a-1]|uniref:NAD(P)-binding domain-containing protein n=1 Tax=Gaeumannomyces tritici (strain R3-111a-1) TaxID=644352 RepID=J3NMQ2_GAET3|nr:hypothetical protein GGTG_02558 [Gaeumannomyces tritici R3-111a-1]EJT82585.1 hypothetical protein GGTG_02558 [Gaeumannomyces tritici R3-111a-1]
MSNTKISVIVTGKGEHIGKPVIEALLPEIEVIHYTLAEAIDRELPLLLRGEQPDPKSSNLASARWESGPPVALLLGGAYDEAAIQRLRRSLGLVGASDDEPATATSIPWIRIDSKKSTVKPTDPGYAADVTRRMKETVLKLNSEGKLGVKDNSVYAI